MAVFLFASLLAAFSLTGCTQEDTPDGQTTVDTGVLADTGDLTEQNCTDEGMVLCGDLCRDLDTDSLHCGECDNPCGSGHSCIDGECELLCPAGQSICDGGCYNLQNSTQHCGECDSACDLGETCVDGECALVCAGDLTACSGVCVDLQSSTLNCGECGKQCDTGVYCVEGECRIICPSTMEVCGDECVSLNNDPLNCGACGTKCDSGKQCIDGECTLGCGINQTVCDDACADLNTDRNHCGECGNVCDPGKACFDGECVLSCPQDLVKCDDTCVNVDNDRYNCGRCGKRCTSEETCDGGFCIIDCPTGRQECDGGCVNTDTDRYHCGDCNNVCDPGRICEDGDCVLSCPGTQVVCGEECVYTDTDTRHCGDCDQPCGIGQVCSDGECGMVCRTGYELCDDACADLNTDRNHCGECGNECLSSQVCNNGNCEGACPEGFDDCGVCVDLSRDINHCGICDNPCVGDEICRSGECYLSVTSVTLNHTGLTMLLDEEEELEAEVLPFEATDTTIDWSSSNSSVATVDENGLVTAVGPGTATITAENLDSGRHDTCVITVIVPVEDVEIDPSHLSLLPGGQGRLTAVIYPANATNKEVVWTSLNENLVTVEANGTVRARTTEGQTEVKVTTVDGDLEAVAVVVVSGTKVSEVVVTPPHLNMIPGESASLTVSFIPVDATNTNVVWTTSNSSVATVNSINGRVTAVGQGQAVITAIAADGGHRDDCLVTVSIPVTGVDMDYEEVTLNRNETLQLSGTIVPANATDQGVSWSSDNTDVAIVDGNGLVTGVGVGVTFIRISTNDGGYTDQCQVTILVPVEGITVIPSSMLIWPNEQAQLEVQFQPHDATNQQLACKAFSPAIADIDCATLTITAHTTGTALIGIIPAETLKAELVEVNVALPVAGVTVDPQKLTLSVGGSEQLTALVAPAEANNKNVRWESANPDIATVSSSGLVTLHAKGETTITVITIDGEHTDTCVVKAMLYDFTDHTFTNCGATGQNGPTVAQCRSSYSAKNWAEDSDLFNVTSGIQQWTAPADGTYRIEVWGASGASGGAAGGKGARMRGDFVLEEGEKLRILVGQQGGAQSNGAGGGGGTYVFPLSNNTPLIVAGGGGGGSNASYYDSTRVQGTTSTTANHGHRWSTAAGGGAGGVGGGSNDNGKYYNSSYCSGGGGGVNTNGQGCSNSYGRSFLNGGTGGTAYSGSGHGGFGGGAGGTSYSCSAYCQGGGGGGYAGGGNGYDYGNGGGGGSFNSGENQSNSSGIRTGHGQVVITLLAD